MRPMEYIELGYGYRLHRRDSANWELQEFRKPSNKAIGNSMAVPVMRWLGERIEAADRI